MTKLQALDKFCIIENYNENKLEVETKVQFLNRRKAEIGQSWALERVRTQVINEREDIKQTSVATDVTGLDI